jgi:hypothetical protein
LIIRWAPVLMVSVELALPSMLPPVDQREVGIADRAGAGDGVAGIGQRRRASVSDDGVTVRQNDLAATR